MSGETTACNICKRELNTDDPLSADCGGDCWGCIGWIEFHTGHDPKGRVADEIAKGLRAASGQPADKLPKAELKQ